MKSQKTRKKMTILKQLRNRLDISQEYLARELDVSVFQISRWERGQTEFSMTLSQFKKFVALLEGLGVAMQDLPDDIWGDLPFNKKL